ncbi:MAG: AAA family ATPase [Oscillospiraceae bacterium]
MYTTYVRRLELPSDNQEASFINYQRRTCYNGIYPFKIFPKKELEDLELGPITIFCGGNGSGKTTLLNVLAEKLNIMRHSAFSGSAFFTNYTALCKVSGNEIPENSQILTSDDVFDYLLNVRYLNDGIDVRREELFEDYLSRKWEDHRNLRGLDDYDDWKISHDAKSKTQSRFVKDRLSRNVDMFSNGESAMKFFTDHITENALYLMDEPENSLSIGLQMELSKYISDSARHFGCQFIMSTHSPVFLAMKDALIYDLDEVPVTTKKWTELDNVRKYFDFFEEHRSEFMQE